MHQIGVRTGEKFSLKTGHFVKRWGNTPKEHFNLMISTWEFQFSTWKFSSATGMQFTGTEVPYSCMPQLYVSRRIRANCGSTHLALTYLKFKVNSKWIDFNDVRRFSAIVLRSSNKFAIQIYHSSSLFKFINLSFKFKNLNLSFEPIHRFNHSNHSNH